MMRRMMKKQNGVTTMGIVLMLLVLAGVVTIVLRLFPLYNEKFQVTAALNSIVSSSDPKSLTTKKAGKSFMKAMAITNIERFHDKTIKENLVVIKPKKKGQPKVLHMKYESRNKFFADIYFVMAFDKKLPLTGSSASE